MKILLALCAFFIGATNVLANSLPQVGRRVYLIEKNSAKPVAIKENAVSIDDGEQILRDPTLEMSPRVPKPALPPPKPVVKKRVPASKSKHMAFKPTRIDGSIRNPRVEFQRDYLRVGMSEESYDSDFFEKIAAPLSDTNF